MFKLLLFFSIIAISTCDIPMVVSSWFFGKATQAAWKTLLKTDNSLDALVDGCRTCQELQCDFTVGFGGSPDENGETALDSIIFDGNTMNVGAVANLRNVKNAISVARHVLEYTDHTLLVGSLATQFANEMGFTSESLTTNYSKTLYTNWKANNCQPNFWQNVVPDPKQNCGPYQPEAKCNKVNPLQSNEVMSMCEPPKIHDTIVMIVINKAGHIVAGTSTNGAKYKIPGRVGDGPIPGASAFADSDVGAAVATGDGDTMMRFSPSFLAVERLRMGDSPREAARIAVARISDKFPTFQGAVIAVDKNGTIGAACNGIPYFPYSFANNDHVDPLIVTVICTNII